MTQKQPGNLKLIILVHGAPFSMEAFLGRRPADR